MTRAWARDGLAEKWDQGFRKGCMPWIWSEKSVSQRNLESIEKNWDRLKTPQPDISYGFDTIGLSFNDLQAEVNTRFLEISGLCKGIMHPCVVVEWKGAAGDTQKAENQAALGAYAAALAFRNFQQALGVKLEGTESDGDLDIKSATYAVTVSLQQAIIYAGAFVRVGDRLQIHLQSLKTYVNTSHIALRELRNDFRNILDWAVNTRKAALCAYPPTYDKVEAAAAEAAAHQASAASTLASAPSAPKPRGRPRKDSTPTGKTAGPEAKKRGRPPKGAK